MLVFEKGNMKFIKYSNHILNANSLNRISLEKHFLFMEFKSPENIFNIPVGKFYCEGTINHLFICLANFFNNEDVLFDIDVWIEKFQKKEHKRRKDGN